ncbi:hypothetical protein VCHA49P379_230033 [Vibrio chagasii]|nr:hypothetical protein VCHA49P379_230033 [Vibrio chagasii]
MSYSFTYWEYPRRNVLSTAYHSSHLLVNNVNATNLSSTKNDSVVNVEVFTAIIISAG